MVTEKPQEVEYSNLLAGGLADSRWEHKRYQKCVWTRRNGRLAFMYQNPFSLMHGHGPEWADLAQGGFMGFLGDPVANPFIEVLESSPATTLKTCSVWYDQHIIARAPERPEADGLYHVRARYRLVGLPLAVAKELEDAARDMLPATGGGSGFVQGVVNDYESDNIPPGTLSVGCIWRGGAGGVPDKMVAHSGSVSIRMQGKTSRMSMGGGPPIYLETRNRYRLSVWAKTKGVRGKGFSMRLDEIFWSENDIKASHESKPLTGDQDWTKLEVVFDPVPGDPLAVLYIRLDDEGKGTAWFDDLELMEVAR
jgi:hypothetical protein